MENEYSKVKINNEIDFCSVTEKDVKTVLEKAFMKARVSYFLRWEKPGFFEKVFKNGKTRIVFCINAAQVNTAEEAIAEIGDMDGGVKMLRTKSNNKTGF